MKKAESFPDWLQDQLTRRGYDVSSPRGGGQTAFANDSGISRATVSRLLRGEGTTDIQTLTLVAKALGRPLGDILVRAGVLDERELRAVQHPPGDRYITPEEAADELGITDPQARAVFISMTETLQRNPPTTQEP